MKILGSSEVDSNHTPRAHTRFNRFEENTVLPKIIEVFDVPVYQERR